MLGRLFDLVAVHADAAQEKDEKKDDKEGDKEEEKEEEKDDGGEESGDEEEEEEEEPEDEQPKLREECQQTAKCAPLLKHFEHCQEKVNEGKGFKGEDCVEELFHLMHCADECAGPKLFSKLR